MTTPTSTRPTIRQAVGLQLGMPFYKLYGTNTALTGTPTASKFTSTNLTQKEHYWKGSWVLLTSGTYKGQFRQVNDFLKADKSIIPDRALAGAPAAADTVEILTGWGPSEVHQAINDAIDEGFPYFFDVVTDQTLVLQTNTLQYSLTGLTTTVWKILGVWIEQTGSSMMGTAQAGGASSITADASADLSSVDSTWMVSVYEGTGAGQVVAVVSADNTTKIITTAAWSTNPDSTSKYRLWDASDERYGWHKVLGLKASTKEWPSYFEFKRDYTDFLGMRIRVQYLAKPARLTSETDTTVIPIQYLKLKAASTLLRNNANNNRFDRQRFLDLADTFDQQADMFARKNGFQAPAFSPWTERDETSGLSGMTVSGDPMGWVSD